MSIEEKRAELLSKIPSWYSGVLHFTAINVVGVAAIRILFTLIDLPAVWFWTFIPAFFAFANAFEWWIHRGPMHHPTRLLRLLYQRHTLEHHVIYTEHDLAVTKANELYYILFPVWFLPAIMLANAPIPLLLSYVASPDVGYLFYACILAYYLVYEWFHTVHHLPPRSWLGRRSAVVWVRTHHARHHDPKRMALGNFNVSFPLWDHLLGSCLPPAAGGHN